MSQVQGTFHTVVCLDMKTSCCGSAFSGYPLAPKAWILAICLLIPGALEKRYEAVGKTPGNHFFFFGKSRIPWVREFWNCGWEIGLKLEFWFWSKLPCLANEQGNVPERIMNLTSAPFDSVSCRRCRRRGVGGDFTSCGFWEDVSWVLSRNVEKCCQVGHFTDAQSNPWWHSEGSADQTAWFELGGVGTQYNS